MNSSEFKSAWLSSGFNPQIDSWLEFDKFQIEQSTVNKHTKLFLQAGFPDSAAPFLNFDGLSKGKFLTLTQMFPRFFKNERSKSFWMLGTDGGGNLIAIDDSNDDKIVLLDHEQNFELIDIINENIEQLAQCLLLYRNFVNDVLEKNGEGAYLDGNYTKEQLLKLIQGFNTVDSDILKRSGFWKSQIATL
ncbi:hypothetical protein INP83_20790 [Mucilaginibacter sp. 21P]|uniref:hypothetical protein n=1 Tax=Mucilaginibacter sp. 21P TaxID=2778902 RepID=UPI001C57BDD8|nr:hypothetical protein [Mucilaginibacter sp. 21P]QXV65473.1 hypothetical protein INP83_20790 [Mucilaginibacter sp. 21P]